MASGSSNGGDASKSDRRPITPTLISMAGLVVGLVGVVMLFFGLGGAAQFQLQLSLIGAGIQTMSVALGVMVIGFATAQAPILMAMWVDAQRAGSNSRFSSTYLSHAVRGVQSPAMQPADPASSPTASVEAGPGNTSKGERRPLTPTIISVTGVVVGLLGLAMVFFGLGAGTQFQLQVSWLGAGLQTTSVGLAVMVIGFGSALAPVLMAMWVDGQRKASGGSTGRTYLSTAVRGAHPAPTGREQIDDKDPQP